MNRYIPEALRISVIERAHHLCEYCLLHETDFYLAGHIDHIISIKHGGITSFENLAFACVHCNRNKGSEVAALSYSGEPARLFNPRIDLWGVHFSLSGPRIVPKTIIGESTEKALLFNHIYRVEERSLFIKQGSYPHPDALFLLNF